MQGGSIVLQGGANNLLDLALVQIDAGTKTHNRLSKKWGCSRKASNPKDVGGLHLFDHHRGRVEPQPFAALDLLAIVADNIELDGRVFFRF